MCQTCQKYSLAVLTITRSLHTTTTVGSTSKKRNVAPPPPDLPGLQEGRQRRVPAAVRRLRPRLPHVLPETEAHAGAGGRLVLSELRVRGRCPAPLHATPRLQDAGGLTLSLASRQTDCSPLRSTKTRSRVKKKRYEDDSSEDEAATTVRRSGGGGSGGMTTRHKETTPSSSRSSGDGGGGGAGGGGASSSSKRRRMMTRNQPDLTFCEYVRSRPPRRQTASGFTVEALTMCVWFLFPPPGSS